MLPEVKAQWEAELNSNVVSDDPTFAESVERWLEAKSKPVKENTMVAYTGYANKHIIPMLGHIKTKDIQYAHLQRYIDDLAGDLKVKSLKKHLVVINGALDDAERSGIISSNPARLVQMPREAEKFVGNTLNEEEAKEALSAAQEEGEPMYAIVILGMVYGLRHSEMCGLRWKDIDFENGYIHVCNTVVKGKSGHIEEESTKTEKSNRYLPLIGFTIPYFRDLLQQQISSGSKCDKVCQLSDGSPVLPDYITHKYKEFLAAHNLPDIRVHDMRHTAASLLAAHDATPQQAQEFLGHENISTTLDIYTHITDDMRLSAAANIDRGIGKAAPQEDASEPGQETAPAQAEKPRMTDFKPYVGRKRKSGTGCVTEINDHLFEGRYSPKWPDGKKHARNVYAHTREECEEKLKVLIVEMKAEIAEAQRLKDLGEGDGQPAEGKGKRGKKKN